MNHGRLWVLAATLVTIAAIGGCADDGDFAATATARSPTSAGADTVPITEASGTTTAGAASTTTEAATTTAPAEVEAPAVSGPVSGGLGQANATQVDLAANGYTESEYFVEGTASSYVADGELTANGRWTVSTDSTAEFRTRIIVRAPAATAFSGTVVVEWLNVSAGRDSDPDWTYTSQELMRSGHAWVGVSAQTIGVEGGDGLLGASGGLVGADPQRYGTLQHPGDAYAYDIFTQAAKALTDSDGPAPLGDLVPEHVVAVGESQSAFFLTTYVNAVHRGSEVFDGYLIHSRGVGAAPLEGIADAAAVRTTPVHVRDDIEVPVLVFITETDLTVLGYGAVGQPDSEHVKVWEVAGTAHADQYLLEQAYGAPPGTDVGAMLGCPAPVNSGPQHEVLQAGLHHWLAWVTDGAPPPVSPRIGLASSDPPVIARDERGIALGGIRTPPVDVPTAVLSGDQTPGSTQICSLFGSTVAFDAATLAALYPTAADYLAGFDASLAATVTAGFVLPPDADLMAAAAQRFAGTLG